MTRWVPPGTLAVSGSQGTRWLCAQQVSMQGMSKGSPFQQFLLLQCFTAYNAPSARSAPTTLGYTTASGTPTACRPSLPLVPLPAQCPTASTALSTLYLGPLSPVPHLYHTCSTPAANSSLPLTRTSSPQALRSAAHLGRPWWESVQYPQCTRATRPTESWATLLEDRVGEGPARPPLTRLTLPPHWSSALRAWWWARSPGLPQSWAGHTYVPFPAGP